MSECLPTGTTGTLCDACRPINYDADQLAEALEAGRDPARARYEVLQPEYNLYDRSDYEDGVEPVALAEDLGVITYYGLAGGFLTGKYRTEADAGKSPRWPGWRRGRP